MQWTFSVWMRWFRACWTWSNTASDPDAARPLGREGDIPIWGQQGGGKRFPIRRKSAIVPVPPGQAFEYSSL